MKSIYISGNAPLYGEVTIQGSKNAALPIMAAALLIPGISVLKNCPRIADVEYMCRLLQSIGCFVERDKNEVRIDASAVSRSRLPEEYVTMMRSSVMLMGPMLGRTGEVSLHYPGGCVIGDRPIDIHLKALRSLGTCYSDSDQELEAWTAGLRGTDILLEFPSVGATENAVMAAVAAEGVTRIRRCAMEPEIGSLCAFLRCAGADIRGEQTGCITVRGGKALHPCCFEIPSDRIVAGTYLCACLADGESRLKETIFNDRFVVVAELNRMGTEIDVQDNKLACIPGGRRLTGRQVTASELRGGAALVVAGLCAEGLTAVGNRYFIDRGYEDICRDLRQLGADIDSW